MDEKYKMENVLQLDQNKIPEEKLEEFRNEIKETVSITVNAANITAVEPEGIFGVIHIYNIFWNMLRI